MVNRTFDTCGNINFHYNYKYTNSSECEYNKTEIIPLCICPVTHESCFELNKDIICQFNQVKYKIKMITIFFSYLEIVSTFFKIRILFILNISKDQNFPIQKISL
jgi:hypothetical protein